jgi:N6-adenosine-specific RNA methylase IME4
MLYVIKISLKGSWKLPDSVIPAGLIFIWTPKELYLRVIKAMARWKFEYVENLVWVQLTVNNKLETLPSVYFRRSKLSLLLFKKVTLCNYLIITKVLFVDYKI